MSFHRMNYYRSIPAFVFIIAFSIQSYSQDQPSSIYGPDPMLYNGRLYSSNLPGQVNGHPYLYSPDYEPGDVFIKDMKFCNVLLNYDVYKQELLLKYQDAYGSWRIIMLSKAWLGGFILYDKEFSFMKNKEGKRRFFQVIGSDTLKILFSWEKNLTLSGQTGNSDYYFSDPVRTMYLFNNNGVFRFRNNKSFTGYFESEEKNKITDYLKKNRINIKKASDRTMLDLITYCNHIRHQAAPP
jgi:hypothetical protein